VKEEFLRLLDQSVWANRRWVEFVYTRPEPEERPRELLAHVVLAERVWFERIAGDPRTENTFLRLGREELLESIEENRRTFSGLVGSRLEDVIQFRRGGGEEYHARVADILHHLITHGYHHRGQIAGQYARAGVPYPNTDHIHYLYTNRL